MWVFQKNSIHLIFHYPSTEPSTHAPRHSTFREPVSSEHEDNFEPRPATPPLTTRPQTVAKLPPSFQSAPFQPAPFQPAPFQTGPFQPLPYPALPFQANDAFAPVARPSTPAVTPTAAPLQATSRQTFLLRAGPSRTTPPPPPPQYLRDDSREQYADYSAADAGEERVALRGKVRIHGDGYIECLDVGSFPHPFSCQKFISCAKTEYGALLGWEYTCPKGLSFDPVGGICNWSSGPVCGN